MRREREREKVDAIQTCSCMRVYVCMRRASERAPTYKHSRVPFVCIIDGYIYLKAGSNTPRIKMQSDEVPPIKFFACKTVTCIECSFSTSLPSVPLSPSFFVPSFVPRSSS